MQWFDRLIAAVALKIPAVQRLNSRLSENAQMLMRMRQDEAELHSMLSEEMALQKRSIRARLNEEMEFRSVEAMLRMPNAEAVTFSESKGTFKERLWELELALEDRGWVREVALANLEFSRAGLQRLIQICRIYALKNPLVKRGAEICELYVFGRGVEIRSDDPEANLEIQDFLERNEQEFNATALAKKEQSFQTDGNLYFACITDPKGQVNVQTIDALEIMDVITNPSDSSRD